jgi:molybdenum cofactor cytidylyltransferase
MISAIVLAAGLSSRMGRFKPLLPYGKRTVIEQIVTVLMESSIDETIVVTGFNKQAVETQLEGWPVTLIFNPDYASGEMLTSLQAGMDAVNPQSTAVLLALGDQPAIEQEVVEQVTQAFSKNSACIIIPSYQRRRGHPLLIPRKYWGDVCSLGEGQTLREFLGSFNDIFHVEVYTSSILRDMDTMNDYYRELALLHDSSLVSQSS